MPTRVFKSDPDTIVAHRQILFFYPRNFRLPGCTCITGRRGVFALQHDKDLHLILNRILVDTLSIEYFIYLRRDRRRLRCLAKHNDEGVGL